MDKKTIFKSLLFITFICALSSCAPRGFTPEEYGFLSGVWHGICLPFSIIGKIFGMDIGIAAKNNTGFTYWFGYILSAVLFYSGLISRN